MTDVRCDNNTESCRESRFLLLLVTLLGFIVIEPFLFENTRLQILIDIFLSAVLFSSIYAVSEKKQTAVIAVLLAIPKFTSTWAFNFITHPLLYLFDSIFGIIFIGYIIVLILAHIFKQEEITRETIYGAIVVYILIGILWVFLYNFTEFLHPQSFTFITELGREPRKDLYYFSFVTLTTLGYGDITPISGPARSLAMLEAVTGQMYIAVLIARLVGTHISQSIMKK